MPLTHPGIPPWPGFGPRVCGRLDEGATREWLVPDGRGGYAMGTVSGLRTRRYHGLLVVAGRCTGRAAPRPGQPRPGADLPSGAQVRLATHEWASGGVDPAGHRLLERFDLVDGVPRWRWRIGDVVLERELAMAHGRPARRRGAPAGRPAARYGSTWRRCAPGGTRTASGTADGPPPEVVPAAGGAVVDGAYRLHGPDWRPAGEWWLGVHHREEAARGLNRRRRTSGTRAGSAPRCSGRATRWRSPRGPVTWTRAPRRATSVIVAARRRAPGGGRRGAAGASLAAALALAADAFVVATATGHPDVVAGYPWFGAWSRDTMIAYEGLFLRTGRADEGRELLRGVRGDPVGGDAGQHRRHRPDRVQHRRRARCGSCTRWSGTSTVTGDTDLASELLPGAERGGRRAPGRHPVRHPRRPGRRAARPGRPRAARSPGWTPGWTGCRSPRGPASRSRSTRCGSTGWPPWPRSPRGAGAGRERGCRRLHERGRAPRFRRRFPAPTGWLYDVVDVPGDAVPSDDAVCARTNCSRGRLPYAPLRAGRRAAAPDRRGPADPAWACAASPPTEPGYLGRHRGGPADRDRAYHQGTVWPWLIGPYADACRAGRPAGRRPARRTRGAPDRMGPRLGQRDRRRRATARGHRMPVPGLVGGGDAARPTR